MAYPCPCCGRATLAFQAAFELCDVCFWEDDGQDNHNADEILGGPNANLSLTLARVNFIRCGLFDPKRIDLRPMQEPKEHYPLKRRFVLNVAKSLIEEPDCGWSSDIPDSAV